MRCGVMPGFPVNICWLCGEWLSLGPSNDRGRAREIAMAELLAEIREIPAYTGAWDDQIVELYAGRHR